MRTLTRSWKSWTKWLKRLSSLKDNNGMQTSKYRFPDPTRPKPEDLPRANSPSGSVEVHRSDMRNKKEYKVEIREKVPSEMEQVVKKEALLSLKPKPGQFIMAVRITKMIADIEDLSSWTQRWQEHNPP
ncbi:hypothetical protein Tco_0741735 [Tanacetum coccineum]